MHEHDEKVSDDKTKLDGEESSGDSFPPGER
jgi:hypothetical protein